MQAAHYKYAIFVLLDQYLKLKLLSLHRKSIYRLSFDKNLKLKLELAHARKCE